MVVSMLKAWLVSAAVAAQDTVGHLVVIVGMVVMVVTAVMVVKVEVALEAVKVEEVAEALMVEEVVQAELEPFGCREEVDQT